MHVSLNSVSYQYENSAKLLFRGLNASFSQGWTGIVGANGCGKSTLTKIIARLVSPSAGSVSYNGVEIVSSCAQETLLPPVNLQEFIENFERHAQKLKTSLRLHDHTYKDWRQMSHGERKRFQLGCSLLKSPDMLILDEPTNHLDSFCRSAVVDALQSFGGVGVLVSHDRVLLNDVVSQCVLFHQGTVSVVPGNYAEANAALDSLRAEHSNQARAVQEKSKRIASELNRIKQVGQTSPNKLSKRHVAKKDHDAKTKIDAARLTGRDASLAGKQKSLESRLQRLEDEGSRIPHHKDYSDKVFFSNSQSPRKILLNLSAQMINLPGNRKMKIPDLLVRSGDKIGLLGDNGTGKSSLLSTLMEKYFEKEARVFFLRQELGTEQKMSIQNECESLEREGFSRCMEIFARLGSDPKQVFSSRELSSGEIRKLAISLAIVENVDGLVLDEPTNHLDLPSIENLANALAESNLTVLAVSHDRDFVKQVCSESWVFSINTDGKEDFLLTQATE